MDPPRLGLGPFKPRQDLAPSWQDVLRPREAETAFVPGRGLEKSDEA